MCSNSVSVARVTLCRKWPAGTECNDPLEMAATIHVCLPVSFKAGNKNSAQLLEAVITPNQHSQKCLNLSVGPTGSSRKL